MRGFGSIHPAQEAFMSSAPSAVQYINPPGACPAQGLYKHDFDRQFEQVFANLGDVLKGMGCDYNDVIKFTTFLVHSQDIEKFMKARAALFPKLFKGPLYPPNTLLIVDRLVKEDFVVEVEAVVRGRD
jgi:enamine deaminase RidA (YjgF/YER057c/UK114 family)